MKQLKMFIFLCILTFTVSCGQQKKYIEYKVKQGDTMQTIATKLHMETKDLLRLNPDVGRKLIPNTVIIVPNKKGKKIIKETTEKPTKKADTVKKVIEDETNSKTIILNELKKNFVVHEVKKGDTFYSLTRFYNTSKEELISLNPILSEGLKLGQVIKIKPIEEGKSSENSIYEDIIEENKPLKVALMLPFKAKDFDSISPKKIFSKKTSLANIVTDFYLGAEIAVDSLRKKGIAIELNVFDTKKNSTEINTIIAQNNLNANNIIIGPLYSEEAEVVAHKVNIPVVFPFYSKQQYKFSASNLVKTSPEKKAFKQELVNYIKDNLKSGNLILVGNGKTNSNTSNTIFKEALESEYATIKVALLSPKNGYINKARFLEVLKPNTKNWIVLTTNDTVIIADTINSLISLPNGINITVFAFDKSEAFDDIDNFKLAKVALTYVSDSFVDETSLTTQLFNKQYLSKNNVLPSEYATKGFDITYDLLLRLASGNKLKDTFTNGASFRVENKFEYSGNSGIIENNGLFILQYNKDLSLTRLK